MSAGAETATLPSLEAIDAASERIARHIRRTPLRHAPDLSRRAGREVWIKLENLQRTGSFKFRGALNALLSEPARVGPVGAASAGNHAFALAEAARVAGRPAVLFLPRDAPRAKIEGVRSAGGEVRLVDGGYDEAEDAAALWAADTGADLVHGFDDARVVAGQGTLGREIMRQHAGVRSIVAPVGGGGLLAGVHAAVAASGVAVLGAQGDRTRAVHDALAAGTLVETPLEHTLMDGLAGRTTRGALERLAATGARVELVPESEVAEAVRALHALGVRAEGSGAVALAALLARILEPPGPVVAIVSGGNIDDAALDGVLAGDA